MMTNLESPYYYVYILQSKKDGKKYTGYTKDLSSRFEAHPKRKVPSPKHSIPFEFIYFEGCISLSVAVALANYLKTHYGKMFLGNRLKSYFTGQDQNIFNNVGK